MKYHVRACNVITHEGDRYTAGDEIPAEVAMMYPEKARVSGGAPPARQATETRAMTPERTEVEQAPYLDDGASE